MARALAAALGHPVTITRRSPLSGGCIGHVERLDTNAGPFVLKWLPATAAGFFEGEAAGLDALRAAGSGLVVPRVLALVGAARDGDGDDARAPFLVIEFLPPGRAARDVDERLGRGLAAQHRTSARQFGFHCDTFCGATRQPNAWTPDWITFYRSARLGCQVDLATNAGLLASADRRLFDRLLAKLGTRLTEPAEGPALVHGDLWAGNLHITTSGAPALLDPAAHYAHREAELGIMTLFGGVPPRTLDAYAEAFPLDAGWRERHPLYQLYHLLNHLNLFGHGYHAQVMAIARRFA